MQIHTYPTSIKTAIVNTKLVIDSTMPIVVIVMIACSGKTRNDSEKVRMWKLLPGGMGIFSLPVSLFPAR